LQPLGHRRRRGFRLGVVGVGLLQIFSGRLWAVNRTLRPAASGASFSAKASMSRGSRWKLLAQTISARAPVSFLASWVRRKYSPTLNVEYCGARQMAARRSMPSAAMRSMVSRMNGRQLRMP
jgi:hypothetical protein